MELRHVVLVLHGPRQGRTRRACRRNPYQRGVTALAGAGAQPGPPQHDHAYNKDAWGLALEVHELFLDFECEERAETVVVDEPQAARKDIDPCRALFRPAMQVLFPQRGHLVIRFLRGARTAMRAGPCRA